MIQGSGWTVEFLSRVGYDPIYGALPLRRAIQTYLENPLSKRIISGTIKEGSDVTIHASDIANSPEMEKWFTPETALEFEANGGERKVGREE